MTKTQKFCNFQKVYAFFPEFSTDSVNWNNEKGQKEKKGVVQLAFWPFRRVYCISLNENTQIDTKNDKNPKFFVYQSFYAFFSKNFDKLCRL